MGEKPRQNAIAAFAMADDEGFDCRVTMIAHGGWFLAQHAEEPDVRFNVLYGGVRLRCSTGARTSLWA